jgi:hypothetical protein
VELIPRWMSTLNPQGGRNGGQIGREGRLYLDKVVGGVLRATLATLPTFVQDQSPLINVGRRESLLCTLQVSEHLLAIQEEYAILLWLVIYAYTVLIISVRTTMTSGWNYESFCLIVLVDS